MTTMAKGLTRYPITESLTLWHAVKKKHCHLSGLLRTLCVISWLYWVIISLCWIRAAVLPLTAERIWPAFTWPRAWRAFFQRQHRRWQKAHCCPGQCLSSLSDHILIARRSLRLEDLTWIFQKMTLNSFALVDLGDFFVHGQIKMIVKAKFSWLSWHYLSLLILGKW